MIESIRSALKAKASSEKASFLPRFFKTGPGEYGEGDQFLGISVPSQRHIAKQYQEKISRTEWKSLATSQWHEERLTALFILIIWYKKTAPSGKEEYVMLLLELLDHGYVNNWDLVDSTAYTLLGDFLVNNPDKILTIDSLANTGKLWSERMAIVASLAFIRRGEFSITLELVTKFLTHKHDLIHKACGWMLREIGQKSLDVLIDFLQMHSTKMPRTMLRYAIEKLSPETRQQFLQRKNFK